MTVRTPSLKAREAAPPTPPTIIRHTSGRATAYCIHGDCGWHTTAHSWLAANVAGQQHITDKHQGAPEA